MTNTNTIAKIPQALIVTGRPYGPVPTCIGCHHDIDTSYDYWALVNGPPQGRPTLLAAAHCGHWDDQLDDYNDRCADTLHDQWRTAVHNAQAALLRLGADRGGPRFYADDVELHAGTALDVLTPDGTWLAGRFEYDTAKQPWQPLLYLPISGWDLPVVPLRLREDAIVRVPSPSRFTG